MEARVEYLEEENTRLREQVQQLQEALIATAAPAVYQHMVAKRAVVEPDDPKTEELLREAQAVRRYVSELENTNGIFRNADEFMEFFRGGMNPDLHRNMEDVATVAPEAHESIHDNPES